MTTVYQIIYLNAGTRHENYCFNTTVNKIFFSIAAITLLSTAAFATKHKAAKKKEAVKTECVCPAGCPKTPDCPKVCS